MKDKNQCIGIVKDIRLSFINFSHVKRILAALDRMHEYRCGNEEAEHIMLLGESGVGKSTLLSGTSRSILLSSTKNSPKSRSFTCRSANRLPRGFWLVRS